MAVILEAIHLNGASAGWRNKNREQQQFWCVFGHFVWRWTSFFNQHGVWSDASCTLLISTKLWVQTRPEMYIKCTETLLRAENIKKSKGMGLEKFPQFTTGKISTKKQTHSPIYWGFIVRTEKLYNYENVKYSPIWQMRSQSRKETCKRREVDG